MTAGAPLNPMVSVLVTAYNREDYLAEAIESVLAQTRPDFELIVSDDCSSDRTVEIANQYARRDPRSPRVDQRAEPRRLRQSASGGDAGARELPQIPRLRRRDVPALPGVMVDDAVERADGRVCAVGIPQLARRPLPDAADAASRLRARVSRPRAVSVGSGGGVVPDRRVQDAGRFPTNRARVRLPLLGPRLRAGQRPAGARGPCSTIASTPDKEAAKPTNDIAFAHAAGCAWRMLNSAQCPLTGDALERAKRNFAYVQVRGVYRFSNGGASNRRWRCSGTPVQRLANGFVTCDRRGGVRRREPLRPFTRRKTSFAPSATARENRAPAWLVFPDSVGGTEVYVEGLCRRLRAAGHEVLVAAPEVAGRRARTLRTRRRAGIPIPYRRHADAGRDQPSRSGAGRRTFLSFAG